METFWIHTLTARLHTTPHAEPTMCEVAPHMSLRSGSSLTFNHKLSTHLRRPTQCCAAQYICVEAVRCGSMGSRLTSALAILTEQQNL